jgi:diguanylate cyclase (GGDEF)-like protein
MSISLLKNVFRPKVADREELRRYVVSVTLLAWFVALGVDVFNQLYFFTNWADCWRDWTITTIEVIVLAVPIASSIGRAHLELHHAKREADRLGRIDPLTGLANRRAFYEAAEGFGGGVVALAIVDIDRFKRINDHNGHAMGDRVLQAVAALMQDQLGDLGVVARLGGEEFALISAERPTHEIRERLQTFRQRLAGAPAAGRAIHVTVSIGFACRRNGDLDALYAAADKALYVAKSAGRDRVVNYDEIGEVADAEQTPMLRAG